MTTLANIITANIKPTKISTFVLTNHDNKIVITSHNHSQARYITFNIDYINSLDNLQDLCELELYLFRHKNCIPTITVTDGLKVLNAYGLFLKILTFHNKIIHLKPYNMGQYNDYIHTFIQCNNMTYSKNGYGEIIAKYTAR